MNKHVKVIAILFVLSTFLFSGCSKNGSNPKNSLSKYLDALRHERHEEIYQYISTKDKGIKSLQEYVSEQFPNVFTGTISYEIKEIKVTGNQAKAKVAATMPDFASMFTGMMGAAFMSAFGGEKNVDEMEKMLAEKYKDKEIPMTTEIQLFDLVKERDGWKIFLNWEAKEKVNVIMKEAKKLEKDKKLYDAKKKYQQVLELDSKVVEASHKVEKLDKEIKSFKEKQDYISKVRLYAFEARYRNTYRDNKVPAVEFKLKNGGDKTLVEVKVTVYFKDALGNIIAEEDYYPVLVSGYSSRGRKPLRPNYIWQMESGRFYSAESVPSEWQEGNAFAKITDIEFEK